MSGVITSNKFQKLLYPGIKKVYGERDKMWPSEYKKVFQADKSQKAWEEYLGQTGFGLMPVVDEGDAVTFDSQEQGYLARFQHVKYGMGFKVTKEAYTDGVAVKAGIKSAKALNKSKHVTRETICFNTLNRAFNSSYTMGDSHDGKELCATDHPNKTGGTYKNELTTPADISEASLEQMLIDIDSWLDDRGLQFPATAEQLLIHRNDRYEAERLLKNTARPGTADRDINAIKSTGMIPKGYMVCHYLTENKVHFLLTDVEDGLIYIERWKDSFGMDNEWLTQVACYMAIMRFSVGWANPKKVFGNPGS